MHGLLQDREGLTLNIWAVVQETESNPIKMMHTKFCISTQKFVSLEIVHIIYKEKQTNTWSRFD